jgi:hypothetical protein
MYLFAKTGRKARTGIDGAGDGQVLLTVWENQPKVTSYLIVLRAKGCAAR